MRFSRASLRLLVTVGLSLAISAPATAAKKDKNQRVVALFFSAKGKPNNKLYAAVYAELTKAAKKDKAVRLLQGGALKKALKKKPDPLLAKCGSDVACISKLGRSAGAARVVAARVSPAGANIKVQIVIVDVAAGALVTRVDAEVSSVAKAAALIATHEASLFGEAPAAAKDEEIPLDLILDEPPPAVASQAEGGGETGSELPLDLVLAAPTKADPPPPPADEPDVPDEAAAAAEVTAPPAEVLAATPLPSLATPPPQAGRSRLLTYVGVGVAGLGAAALGTGGYFGVQSSSTRSSVRRGADGDTQLQGKQKQDDANAQAGRANLLFAVGGGLVAAGAGLVVIDLFVLGPSAPEPRLSVGSGSAALSLTWGF